MKIIVDIPDPEKAEAFLQHFVPNLPFINGASVLEENEPLGYTVEGLQELAEEAPEDQAWTYSLVKKVFPQDLSLKVEVINSELTIMPAPTPIHQMISDELAFQLNVFVRQNKLGQVITAPIDVVFDEQNVVQPDLIFISISNATAIGEKNITKAPDIVMEIWSLGNSTKSRQAKRKLYEGSGVLEFWAIDPQLQEVLVEVLNAEGKHEEYSKATNAGTVKSKVLEGFEVKIEEILGR